MSRYDAMFARCRAEGRIAFGGFLMLGHPSIDKTPAFLDALVEGGADMVELGIPFSDPVADGPVIARAGKEALEAGVTPDDCLKLLADFRARHPDVPVGILTYANIVMARGRTRRSPRFCAERSAKTPRIKPQTKMRARMLEENIPQSPPARCPAVRAGPAASTPARK